VEIQSSKEKLDLMCIIGISLGSTICESLREFYETVKHYDLDNGDKLFHYYKQFEGKFFRNEANFVLYNKSKSSRDLINVSVGNKEIKEFEKLCKEYGVDILYLKRPENLEELFSKYNQGIEISQNQENIVKAFVIKDKNGNLHLKQDASLIVFNSLDIDVMERVLDRLEYKTLTIQKRKLQAKKIMDKIQKNPHQKEKDIRKKEKVK